MKRQDAAELKGKREDANLDRRYGKIGISAVAAAVAYQGDVNNSSETAVVARVEQWLIERAAA